jgi:phosphatidylinositol glycan class H protein
MLTTSPHLLIRQPSPTTIEYTVTTVPARTLRFRLLLYTTHLLRISLGLFLLLLLYTKYTLIFPSHHEAPPAQPDFFTNENIWYTLHQLSTTQLGALAHTASTLPLPLLVPLTTLLTGILLLHPHTTETLLLLRGLGIQVSSSPPTYLQSTSTRFIPLEEIQDLFVNEVFKGNEVRFCLVVVVRGESGVVGVFRRLLPGRAVCERVWRGGRRCLWGEGKAQGENKVKGGD